MERYLTVLLAALVLLAGCATVQSPVANVDGSPTAAAVPLTSTDGSTPTVSVSASGSAAAAPDLAVVRLAVEHTAPTADEARGLVAADVKRMREALREAGVPDENVSTTAFAIHVVYDYSGEDREVDGYRAVHAFGVETAPDDAGRVVDTAVGAGATRVDGVQFTLSDDARRTLRAEALGDAMVNAESDASALAAAAGGSLGAVASLSTTESGFPGPYPVFAESRADSGAATTFEPGPVTVTAQVTVVYELARP